jgi:hypothetical protein
MLWQALLKENIRKSLGNWCQGKAKVNSKVKPKATPRLTPRSNPWEPMGADLLPWSELWEQICSHGGSMGADPS